MKLILKVLITIFIIIITYSGYYYFSQKENNINIANKLQESGKYDKATKIAQKEAQNVKESVNYYYIAEIIYNSCISDSDPKLIQAIQYYQLTINSGYIDAGVRIADIYNYCNLPEFGIPNKQLARSIYERLTREGQDPNIRMECAIKFNEISNENKKKVNLREEINKSQKETNKIIPKDIIKPKKIPINNIIRNDSQNVHDSGVQRHIKKTVEKLRNLSKYNQYSSNPKKTITEIKDQIKQANILARKKVLAIKTLDCMEKDNVNIMNIDMNETEVLSLVWNRCHSIENKYNLENLKENLILQLADCIVQNKPVCPQGRVSRIVLTLQKIDADESLCDIKPKWAIQEELQQLVAKIREETLKEASEAEISAYNQDLETPDNEHITQRIKDNINKRTLKEYQITGILTQAELKKELEPLLSEI